MNNSFKGVLYIALGASSYGILATFVKFANNNGFGTGGLTFSQFLFGALVLSVWSIFFPKKQVESIKKQKIAKYPKLKLILWGATLGFTSSFYYLSIQYIPVSVGIILLMQTIWMGVVLEFIIARHLINKTKITGAIAVIAGTALAAKVFETNIVINFTGIGFGLLAALSYTGAVYASNKVSLGLPIITRSKYLVYGGFFVVILFWNVQILEEFNWFVFFKWGCFLGLFGTIIPPLLYTKGFPIIGTGLGSIIAALEIPISVFSAYLVLGEDITVLQWIGVAIVLFSVLLINQQNVFGKQRTANNR